MNKNDFQLTFNKLKSMLQKYEEFLTVISNSKDAYNLNAGYSKKYKQDIFFGGAQVKKNYVSFYLMPVYIHPQLLKGISPSLKKRMQGKSCFNFIEIDEKLLKELSALTKIGFDYYKKNLMI